MEPTWTSDCGTVRQDCHVLSLGAGVQSTVLYLMGMDGELERPDGSPLRFDAVVFGDTGEEPDGVYRHLEWLQSLGGPKITVRSAGKLGDDLIKGITRPDQTTPPVIQEHHRHRFASIPAYTAMEEGKPLGIVQRQCTSEYKIEVVDRVIRRELLKLEPRQRIPRGVVINQYIGFSTDEAGRASRTKARYKMLKGWEVHFPLFDLQMTRQDCIRYLDKRVPHPVPRSACVFCPFKSNREWRLLRDTDPAGWSRAVEIDNALRSDGALAGVGLDQELYVHRSCRPLERAYLGDDQKDLFDMDCEGGCGL